MALVTLRESQINAIGQRGRRGRRSRPSPATPTLPLGGADRSDRRRVRLGGVRCDIDRPVLAPVLESWGLAPALALTIATLVLTLVIAYLSLVLGELVPKRLAIQRNAQFAYAVAPALNCFATVMRPVIWLLSVSTNALVRLLGGDPHKTSDEMTDEEVRDIVASHQGLPDDERRILDDVLSLRGRQVSEVMRPRPEVVALDEAASVGEVMAQVRDLPFSRYPVSETSIDDITGFVHVRDLFEAASDDRRGAARAHARDPVHPLVRACAADPDPMRAEGPPQSPSSSTSTAAPMASSLWKTSWKRWSARSSTSTTPRCSSPQTTDSTGGFNPAGLRGGHGSGDCRADRPTPSPGS